MYRLHKCVLVSVMVVLALWSCTGGQQKDRPATSTKFDQYYVRGRELYVINCSNCHQQNGTGLGRVYPPLHQSDFMDNHFEAVICLMKNGKQGELVVNGKHFNQTMPAMPSLSDLEVAEIATYIYNTWTHEKGIVEVSEVSRLLSRCEPDSLSN